MAAPRLPWETEHRPVLALCILVRQERGYQGDGSPWRNPPSARLLQP
jgi:hypothetical protein